MTHPQDFEWPLPWTLTEEGLNQVRVGLIAGAAAFKETIVDEPTNYMACFAAAQVAFIEDCIDARRDGTFRYIAREDPTDDE